MATTLLEKVLSLQDKFKNLQEQLSSPEAMSDMKKYVQLNKDYKELEPIIKAGLEYKKTLDNIASAKDILAYSDALGYAQQVRLAAQDIVLAADGLDGFVHSEES